MFKKLKVTYAYNDVSLVPSYSELKSRSEADPQMHGYKLPIIASCMDKLGRNLMEEIIGSNIPFIAHRSFKTAKEQYEYFIPEFKKVAPFNRYKNIWFAVGSVQKYKDWIDYLYFGVGVRNFCVDMAHGDSKSCVDTIKYIKSLRANNDISNKDITLNDKYFKSIPKETEQDKTHVIAGNVASLDGFKRLQKAGADGIRVGIASGSICFTGDTEVTVWNGHGNKFYQKQIKHINIGDLVLTANGKFREVVKTYKNPYIGEIYKINNDIKVTPTHKFHVFDHVKGEKTYLPIKDYDVERYSFLDHENKTYKVDLDIDEYSGDVYNIEVDDEHTYTVGSNQFGVSNCSTALETGMGVPILTNIMEISPYKKNTWLIADGGANHTGDIAKAIYFGADFVMMGKMLAATDVTEGTCYNKFQEEVYDPIYPQDDIATILKEAMQKDINSGNISQEDLDYIEKTHENMLTWGNNPKYSNLYHAIHRIVKYKAYNGMASRDARKDLLSYASVEGRSGLIEYDCSTKQFIHDTYLRLQASLSYGGAHNWKEFRKKVKAVRRSQAAISAGKTHLDVLFDK